MVAQHGSLIYMVIASLAALFVAGGCAVENHDSPPARVSPAAMAEPDASVKPARTLSARRSASEPKSEVIGRSVRGEPIQMWIFPSDLPAPENVLLFAGIHGDEQSTVGVMRRFVDDLKSQNAKLDADVYIIPLANPDGFADRSRTNASKVDLNRNFPANNWKTTQRRTQYWNGPSPLSEPESKALHDLVRKVRPIRILSMHSIKAGRHGNNYDGPAGALAELLASKNGYNVLPTMGYPTPGSFGSWAGVDLNIPTITLELPSNVSSDKAWPQNREALWAFVRGE